MFILDFLFLSAELVYIYYTTFVIITSFIVLNLFIAVIIGGFEDAMKNENGFSQDVFETFTDEWAKVLIVCMRVREREHV